MSMSRKDYKAIAAAIRGAVEHREHHPDYASRIALEDIADSIADHMEQDNPRFDRDKFYAAAGVAVPK